MSQKLTFDVAVMHVPGCRLTGHSDQEMSHLGREVTQREDRQHVRFVQETQFFDVRMHGCGLCVTVIILKQYTRFTILSNATRRNGNENESW